MMTTGFFPTLPSQDAAILGTSILLRGRDAGAPMPGRALLKPNTQHEAKEHQDISWHPDATLHLPQHPRERGWLGLGCSWGLLGLGYRLGWAHPPRMPTTHQPFPS